MPFRAAFYKGTHPGWPGVYNYAVRKWERGPHSHAELVFSDGLSASSSYMDKGVRFKRIDYSTDANWDFVELPPELEPAARAYFELHKDEAYNILGNLHFVIGFVPSAPRKKFCSEALAGALGFADAWRFEPNVLYTTLKRLFVVNLPVAQ